MPMNRVCETTGAEFPLFAFSHCRDVIAAVSKAGGMGVLGAVALGQAAGKIRSLEPVQR